MNALMLSGQQAFCTRALDAFTNPTIKLLKLCKHRNIRPFVPPSFLVLPSCEMVGRYPRVLFIPGLQHTRLSEILVTPHLTHTNLLRKTQQGLTILYESVHCWPFSLLTLLVLHFVRRL